MATNPPKLVSGPYAAPVCCVGNRLPCEHVGRERVVGGLTDAPIPWPYARKTGRRSLILCGDLIRAVRIESVEAICYYWGVGEVTAWKWRKALGVGRMTAGTQEIYREIMPERLSEEARERGRANARSIEARAKLSKARKGKPAHPKTRRALAESARRVKSLLHRYHLGISHGGTRQRVIANMLARGVSAREISAALDISARHVYRLARSEAWSGASWRRVHRRKRQARAKFNATLLRRARNAVGLLQADVAYRVGVTPERVVAVERNGCTNPLAIRILRAIARKR